MKIERGFPYRVYKGTVKEKDMSYHSDKALMQAFEAMVSEDEKVKPSELEITPTPVPAGWDKAETDHD